MWETREQPSQALPRKSEKAAQQPIQVQAFKEIIAKSDGDISISKREEAVIAFFDKELYDKVSPEMQQEWVRQIIFALRKYKFEQGEARTMCEIALKRSGRGGKETGSERGNDIIDAISHRDHCDTLESAEYAPKKLSDIRMIAGYFRHIYNDPKQRARYVDYLKSHRDQQKKFLDFWTSNNTVKYYLESNGESSIVGNIDSFSDELRNGKRAQLEVSSAIHYFDKPEWASSIVKAFLDDPKKASEELTNELAKNPIIMMQSIWAMDRRGTLRKALLEQTQGDRVIAQIDAAYIAAIKRYRIYVDKASVADLDGPGTARIIAREVVKKNIFQADSANGSQLNYSIQLIGQSYNGFGTGADISKFLRDAGLEKQGTSFEDDTELQAMIIVSSRKAPHMNPLLSLVLGAHRGKSIEGILSKGSVAEVKKFLDSSELDLMDRASATEKAHSDTPFDLARGVIAVSAPGKHGFVFQKEADYKAEVKRQGFREVNLVNLRNYIKYVGAKKEGISESLANLFGISDPVNCMEKIVALGSQLNVDVMSGKHGPAPKNKDGEGRDEIQQLFIAYLLPQFQPIVESLKIHAMGAQTVSIIESTTGHKLSKQDRDEVMRALEAKNGKQVSSIEYIRVIHEHVKSPAHRAEIIKEIMAADTKFSVAVAGTETKRAGRNLSPTLAQALRKNGLHIKGNSFAILTDGEALIVDRMARDPEKYGLSKEDAHALEKIAEKDRLVVRIRENASHAGNAEVYAKIESTDQAVHMATKASEATKAKMRMEGANIRIREITAGKTQAEIENDPGARREISQLKQEVKTETEIINEINRETHGALKIASAEEVERIVANYAPEFSSELSSSLRWSETDTPEKPARPKDFSSETKRQTENQQAEKWSGTARSYANLDQMASLEPHKTFSLDTDGRYAIRSLDSGAIMLEIGHNERVKIPQSEAKLALSFIEVAQKIGEIDMIRNMQPMLRTIRANGLFANLDDGMSNREELELMKYLVRLYGIEDVNLSATDPTALANSIRLNAQKKGNSFFDRGRAIGLLDQQGNIRISQLDARIESTALKSRNSVAA